MDTQTNNIQILSLQLTKTKATKIEVQVRLNKSQCQVILNLVMYTPNTLIHNILHNKNQNINNHTLTIKTQEQLKVGKIKAENVD